ncbi:MAG: G-D-S-L family lipolytic protein [Maribacter sp.]|nr:MAG: G-D-S-L family lipolytic protein [Maribacter sp.]
MRFLATTLFFFIVLNGNSQDPGRFKSDVDHIQKKYDTLWDATKETTLFTGSSSIRIWKDLENRFPNDQIVNSGFGGSHASDLLAFSNELILKYKPSKVFIYEGDNDIASGKKPRDIIRTIEQIVHTIRTGEPKTKIILISAKPSLSRWSLRHKYQRLNKKLQRLCKKNALTEYANVWDPMLRKRKPIPDLFIEDGLHMNTKGYDIWHSVLEPFTKH